MNKITLLKSMIDIADIHQKRIDAAHTILTALFPMDLLKLEKLNSNDYPYIDQMIMRFSNLQDLIGSKIFPQYLNMVGEDSERMTFIDCLNKLEKLHIIESAEVWKQYKILRNHLTHEYPNNPELTVKYLNEVYTQSHHLVAEWTVIKERMSALGLAPFSIP